MIEDPRSRRYRSSEKSSSDSGQPARPSRLSLVVSLLAGMLVGIVIAVIYARSGQQYQSGLEGRVQDLAAEVTRLEAEAVQIKKSADAEASTARGRIGELEKQVNAARATQAANATVLSTAQATAARLKESVKENDDLRQQLKDINAKLSSVCKQFPRGQRPADCGV